MRILFVTPLFFPSLSGAAVYFETLSREIHRQDPSTRLTLLTRRLPGAPTVARAGALRVLRLLPRARPGRDTTMRGRLDAIATGAIVLAAARLLRSDVVHYHTLVSYRVLPRLAPFLGARLVADVRDLAVADEGARAAPYARCDRIICAAENIRDHLARQGLPPDTLVHIPVPFAPLPPASREDIAAVRARVGVPDGAPYVVYVGHVTAGKGVGELLDAMERLWRERPDLHLVLAGARALGAAGGFDRRLDAFLARHPSAHHAGPVPRHAIAALLTAAAVFVLPSPSEGLPRSCLEALSVGTRVVLPPGVPEFRRQCPEAVLERIEPAVIAQAIARALEAPAPAVYSLAVHDPADVAARTLALYRDLPRHAHPTRPRRR